jgi:hypothetical protein
MAIGLTRFGVISFLFATAVLGLASPTFAANPIIVTSPDRKVKVVLSATDGTVRFRVMVDGKQVLAPSKIGVLSNGVELGEDAVVGKPRFRKVDEQYKFCPRCPSCPWNPSKQPEKSTTLSIAFASSKCGALRFKRMRIEKLFDCTLAPAIVLLAKVPTPGITQNWANRAIQPVGNSSSRRIWQPFYPKRLREHRRFGSETRRKLAHPRPLSQGHPYWKTTSMFPWWCLSSLRRAFLSQRIDEVFRSRRHRRRHGLKDIPGGSGSLPAASR